MTTEPKFTPGPWEVDPATAHPWRVTCPTRGFEDIPEARNKVCEVGYRPNAHLIAASPALADAAAPLVHEISEYPPSMGEDDDELVEVRLGDLKALGRALKLALGGQEL